MTVTKAKNRREAAVQNVQSLTCDVAKNATNVAPFASPALLHSAVITTSFKQCSTPSAPSFGPYVQVRLEANKAKYPILLSNGNKADEGPVEDAPHRHFAVFDDPHPKPSYLFAILAGNFEAIRDTFTTKVSLSRLSPNFPV